MTFNQPTDPMKTEISAYVPGTRVFAAVVLALVTACGGSGGGSSDGSDRGSNSLPSLQLNDGDVLGGGSTVVRIPAGDLSLIHI